MSEDNYSKTTAIVVKTTTITTTHRFGNNNNDNGQNRGEDKSAWENQRRRCSGSVTPLPKIWRRWGRHQRRRRQGMDKTKEVSGNAWKPIKTWCAG